VCQLPAFSAGMYCWYGGATSLWGNLSTIYPWMNAQENEQGCGRSLQTQCITNEPTSIVRLLNLSALGSTAGVQSHIRAMCTALTTRFVYYVQYTTLFWMRDTPVPIPAALLARILPSGWRCRYLSCCTGLVGLLAMSLQFHASSAKYIVLCGFDAPLPQLQC
jgi:hypothetical protein